MIITCPSCQKRYVVADELLKETGRQVQCISCAYLWNFQPSNIAINTKKTSEETNKKLQKKMPRLWKILLTSALLVSVIIASLFFYKNRIMNKFPETARIYSKLGIFPLTKSPITLTELNYIVTEDPRGPKTTLTGSMINTSDRSHKIKHLKVLIKGKCDKASLMNRVVNYYILKGNEDTCRLASWVYEPSSTEIATGEKINFETYSHETFKGMKSLYVAVIE